jgi:hypothetical protein
MSTIRDPAELVEACPEHRQYAADHHLELEPFLAEVRTAARAQALSPDEVRSRLATLLATAVEQRPAVGGAA